MLDDIIISEHKSTRQLIETVIIPQHEKRTESKEFAESKAKLLKDGHYKCWICDSEENLQVHHFFCEWSLLNDCDFNKLKELCELFDIYGYSSEMKNEPITTADDIRNMMVLCQEHHTHPINGIHSITFPIWLSQKISKKGMCPVPESTTPGDNNGL